MVASAGLAVASAPMIDQSKQAPLGAVTIVFSSILAALLVGEILTVLDALSTLIIIVGTVVAVTSNNAASTSYTFSETVDLLQDTVVFVYTGILLTAFIVLGWFVERTSRIPFEAWSPRVRQVFSLAAPALGGFAQGWTGYTSKVVATVIFNGETSSFSSAAFYVYCVLLVAAVFLQVRFLNMGLAYFTALQIIPVFQTCIIFSNSLAGIVYYHDMRSAEPWRLAVFAIGAVSCGFGISLLLLKKPPPPPLPAQKEDPFSVAGGGVSGAVRNPLSASLKKSLAAESVFTSASAAAASSASTSSDDSSEASSRHSRVQSALRDRDAAATSLSSSMHAISDYGGSRESASSSSADGEISRKLSNVALIRPANGSGSVEGAWYHRELVPVLRGLVGLK